MKNYKKKLNVYMASLVYWRTVAEINLIKIKQLWSQEEAQNDN